MYFKLNLLSAPIDDSACRQYCLTAYRPRLHMTAWIHDRAEPCITLCKFIQLRSTQTRCYEAMLAKKHWSGKGKWRDLTCN